MDSKLIDLLRCPACKGTDLVISGKKRVALVCRECKHRTRVLDDIPRFVAAGDQGFNERWQRHAKPQANDGRNQAIFEDKTGWHSWDMDGKTFLVGGCGAGRFPRLAVDNGATIIGVDGTATGLEGTAKLVPEALLLQADLLDLSMLRDGCVDAAWSIGVLHHTADPEKAFNEIARCIKPGGSFAVWVYVQHTTDPALLAPLEMFHAITRCCPPGKLYEAIEKYAPGVRDTYNKAWGPLQQILRVSIEENNEDCISDTFDWHTPQYRSWHTEAEVRGWFEAAGFSVDRVGDFPVTMRGVKN